MRLGAAEIGADFRDRALLRSRQRERQRGDDLSAPSAPAR